MGSRDPEKAKGIVEELRQRWGDRVATLQAAHNEEAAACEIVIIAVTWEAAADTAAAHADALAGKPVVSMANGLEKIGDEFRAVMPEEGSVALAVQAAAPEAHVTAAFHHVPAAAFADLDSEMEDDITVVGDDEEARATVISLVSSIPSVRAFDGGSLHNSVGLEAFAAVLLTASLRHRGRGSVALRGIEP